MDREFFFISNKSPNLLTRSSAHTVVSARGSAQAVVRICPSGRQRPPLLHYSRGHNPLEVVETFDKVGRKSRTEARRKEVNEENLGPKKQRFFTSFNPHFHHWSPCNTEQSFFAL